MALTLFDKDLDIIAKLADEPNDVGGLGADQFKAEFDKAGNIIKDYINKTLIPEVESDIDKAAQGIGTGGGINGESILDDSIPDAKIKGVNGSKITDGTITGGKLAKATITREKLADDAIMLQSEDFPNKVVPNRALADKCVDEFKLDDESVTTPKVADSAITRAKLAQDALYSPTVNTNTRNITVSDLGALIYNTYNNSATYTLTQANSTNIPRYGEIAFARWGVSNIDVLIVADGVRFGITGNDTLLKNATLRITEPFGMVALKKLSPSSTDGDAWLVTGNVEVVT